MLLGLIVLDQAVEDEPGYEATGCVGQEYGVKLFSVAYGADDKLVDSSVEITPSYEKCQKKRCPN